MWGYNLRRNSVTTYLIIINVLVFIVELFLGGSMSNNFITNTFTMYTPYIYSGQIWRLFTSMFLHFGAIHLCMNMLALYNIGYYLEDYLGPKKYLLLYLIGGICGNIFVIFSDLIFGSSAIGAGASGAIFAVLGGILYIAKNRSDSGLDLKAVIFSVIFALAPGFMVSGISLSAHLGGLVGGYIMMLIMDNK